MKNFGEFSEEYLIPGGVGRGDHDLILVADGSQTVTASLEIYVEFLTMARDGNN